MPGYPDVYLKKKPPTYNWGGFPRWPTYLTLRLVASDWFSPLPAYSNAVFETYYFTAWESRKLESSLSNMIRRTISRSTEMDTNLWFRYFHSIEEVGLREINLSIVIGINLFLLLRRLQLYHYQAEALCVTLDWLIDWSKLFEHLKLSRCLRWTIGEICVHKSSCSIEFLRSGLICLNFF